MKKPGMILVLMTLVVPNSVSQIIVSDDNNVSSGGILEIDAGTLINGNITIHSGGTLRVLNNGAIFVNYNDEISVESGGVFDISEGEIIENIIQ